MSFLDNVQDVICQEARTWSFTSFLEKRRLRLTRILSAYDDDDDDDDDCTLNIDLDA
jgi:hypothetical protein